MPSKGGKQLRKDFGHGFKAKNNLILCNQKQQSEINVIRNLLGFIQVMKHINVLDPGLFARFDLKNDSNRKFQANK